MNRELQWEVTVHINAPVTEVWDAIEDLSLIPRYHPVVRNVEYVSGQTKRAPGVAYKCIVPDGRQKGWCIERVIEHIPNRRTTVAFSDDSWGMGRMFDDFLAETTVEPKGDDITLVQLKAHYHPRGAKMRLIHFLFMRSMMRKRALRTLEGLKQVIESSR